MQQIGIAAFLHAAGVLTYDSLALKLKWWTGNSSPLQTVALCHWCQQIFVGLVHVRMDGGVRTQERTSCTAALPLVSCGLP